MAAGWIGIDQTSAEIEALAEPCLTTEAFMVPAFAGLGAPHWDQYARGTIHGLDARHNRRAPGPRRPKSIAFQTADVLEAMEADAKMPVKELRVDGGATVNDALMQFQADMLGVPLVRPKVTETTALGAAYLAGLAVGFWTMDELESRCGSANEPSSGNGPGTRRNLKRG